jgi:hypothetical protein
MLPLLLLLLLLLIATGTMNRGAVLTLALCVRRMVRPVLELRFRSGGSGGCSGCCGGGGG